MSELFTDFARRSAKAHKYFRNLSASAKTYISCTSLYTILASRYIFISRSFSSPSAYKTNNTHARCLTSAKRRSAYQMRHHAKGARWFFVTILLRSGGLNKNAQCSQQIGTRGRRNTKRAELTTYCSANHLTYLPLAPQLNNNCFVSMGIAALLHAWQKYHLVGAARVIR